MRLVQPSDGHIAAALNLDPPVGTGLSPHEIAAELEAGRLRSEWSIIAVDDTGAVVGRAMWWGRDASAPIALDVWDVARSVPQRSRLATALLTAGHEMLHGLGFQTPLPHTLRLQHDWHRDGTIRHEVDLLVQAAGAAGLTRVNERLQFQWDTDRPLPPIRGSLIFTPADDATFTQLFAEAVVGSLDVMTRRELASHSAEELARSEMDYYRSCPGDRDWWRVAAIPGGAVVGFVIPSATPTNRNVGYLAVLPEHRGRGHVHELLAFITRFHAGQRAPRVTATTDTTNVPMAQAFRRAGYRCTQVRLDLEPT